MSPQERLRWILGSSCSVRKRNQSHLTGCREPRVDFPVPACFSQQPPTERQ